MKRDIYTKCELCDKEYENCFFTYYIQQADDAETKKCVCPNCKNKQKHIKSFYFETKAEPLTKQDVVTRFFNKREDVIDYILNNTQEDYVACMEYMDNSFSTIVAVNEKDGSWSVMGAANINEGDLPLWYSKVTEINFKRRNTK